MAKGKGNKKNAPKAPKKPLAPKKKKQLEEGQPQGDGEDQEYNQHQDNQENEQNQHEEVEEINEEDLPKEEPVQNMEQQNNNLLDAEQKQQENMVMNVSSTQQQQSVPEQNRNISSRKSNRSNKSHASRQFNISGNENDNKQEVKPANQQEPASQKFDLLDQKNNDTQQQQVNPPSTKKLEQSKPQTKANLQKPGNQPKPLGGDNLQTEPKATERESPQKPKQTMAESGEMFLQQNRKTSQVLSETQRQENKLLADSTQRQLEEAERSPLASSNELHDMDEEKGLKNEKAKPKDPYAQYNFRPKFSTLNAIASCCQSIAKVFKLTQKKMNRCVRRTDKKLQKLKDRTKNYVRITGSFLFIFSFFFLSWIFYVGFSSDAPKITEDDGFHPAKRYTANHLILGSFIFTFYGILFLQIQNYIILYLLFLVQAVPCLFVFLYYGYASYVQSDIGINNNQIINSAFFLGIYIFWLSTWVIKEDLKNFVSNKTKNIALLIWCVFSGAIITGYTVYLTCTTLELNFDWGYQLIQVIGGPYIAMISLMWVYMHFRYFQPLIQRNQLENSQDISEKINEAEQQEKLEKEANQQLLDQMENLNEINEDLQSRQSKDQDIEMIALQLPKSRDNLDQVGQPLDQEQINMEQQQQDELLLQQNVVLQLSPEEIQEQKIKRNKMQLQNYLVLFTSMVLGGSMLFLTILSTLYVAHHLSLGNQKNYENDKAFFLSLFMIVAVPAFVLLATGVIFSKVNDKLKLILIPIFGAMIPLLFSVPLSLVIDYFVETRPLRSYFALGPAGVCIWMITMIYIGYHRWKVAMFLNSYICLFFIIPFLYILPLRNNDIWSNTDEDIGRITYLAMFITGIALVFIVFAIDMIVQVVKTYIQHKNRHKNKLRQGELGQQQVNEFVSGQRFELSNIFKFDLEYFGLWGNALGYILTFTILIYMYYNSPKWITKSQSGNLLGLQVAIIFLFFWCLIILMMRIISEKKKEAVSFSEQISSMISSKHEKAILIDRQKKVRWSIVRFTVLENTVFCIVMMVIFWDNEEVRWNFITMMLGIYVVGLIFCWLYVTKRNLDDFARTAIPAIVVFSWIFLYLPFAGIIPTAIMYLSEDDESLVLYERLVIGGTALLLLFGVALVGLLVHLYFKRREFERKFKYIASKTIKRLAKAHVKSDYASINLAFQGYISKDREDAQKEMTEGKPVYFTEVSKFNPDTRFSKMIIDRQTYDKLQNKKKKQAKTTLQKAIDCVLYYYCCYRDWGADKKNRIYDEENANLLDDGDGEDGQDDLQNMMDRAHEANVQQMEEDDLVEEEDPWMKNYLKNIEDSGYYGDIIEAVRRYDLSQNLQISKPFQSQFIKHLFQLFAQGSKLKFDMPWIDYVMFKQLIVLSHVTPSREFPDHFIDKVYGKFTSYHRMANQNPITENRFTQLLTRVAVIKYPFDPEEHALGKLVKFWLFPYLLWYVKPLHGLYPHEWDYVLFLLKFYNYKDNHDNVIANDVNFRRDLEKYLGINQDGDKFKDKDDGSGRNRCSWSYIMGAIREWCKIFCDNWLYFIKSHCLTDRDMQEQDVDEIEIEVRMVNNTILKPVPFANKRKRVIRHDESPAWPKIVEIMFEEIKSSEREYLKIKDSEFAHLKIRFRITNIFAILFKWIELFALGSLAFTPSVDWGLSKSALDGLNIFNNLSPGIKFGQKFSVAFIAVFVYLFAMYRSVIRIRHHEFGSCEANRKKKNIFTFDFILSLTVNFISMVMGQFMLKTFFDAYSCDYSVKPQTMYQDQAQECFKGTHDTYFGLSILALMILYPEIAYLWPNVQYQNRSLDSKYDPTHQAMASNVKVLVACSAAFFAHQDDAVYMLGTCAFILFLFGFLTKKMKPCLIKIINPLEMGGYYAAGWAHISGIICKFTNPTGGWIALGCGLFIIALISIGFFKILLDLQKDAKRKKKVKIINDDGEEIEIEVDINSDDEEEEEERRRKKEKEESLEYRVWKKTHEFKEYKVSKEEWLDENLIPYKDDELEEIEENKENQMAEKVQEGELLGNVQEKNLEQQVIQANLNMAEKTAVDQNEEKDIEILSHKSAQKSDVPLTSQKNLNASKNTKKSPTKKK